MPVRGSSVPVARLWDAMDSDGAERPGCPRIMEMWDSYPQARAASRGQARACPKGEPDVPVKLLKYQEI